MQTITARTSFVAEAQAMTPFGQPRRRFRQNFRTVLKNPDPVNAPSVLAAGT
jgi:hypothetical protein